MPSTKKLSSEEKTKIEKIKIINDAQLLKLNEIASRVSDIRRTLQDLKGEDNISSILYDIGQCATLADWSEDALYEIVNSYEEEENDNDWQ
jgi:hypothetical protein